MILGSMLALVAALAALGFFLIQSTKLKGQLDESNRRLIEQKSSNDENLVRMEETFKVLAAETLKTQSEAFLTLAGERLDRKTEEAKGVLEQKTVIFQKLVEPIEKTLSTVQKDLGEFERRRGQQFGEITEQIKQVMLTSEGLQREAATLSQALRRPDMRGSWGEIQLRRVVELAGMANHVDFQEQVHLAGEDGRGRPDLVVHLPGKRVIAVDSKAVLTAYLQAVETTDAARRKEFLVAHATNVRARTDELSRKAYWEKLSQVAAHPVDFVVLFIPNEVFLQAALEADPSLIEDGMAKKVLICGPMNLVALLKMMALGWQENQLTENAGKVIAAAKDLYERLGPWVEHLEKVGSGIKSAMSSYDSAVGSLNRRVLPAAKRIRELGLNETRELKELKTLGHEEILEIPGVAAPEKSFDT